MSQHDYYRPISEFELSCQRAVDAAVNDTYEEYTVGVGQLTPDQVDTKARLNPQFHELVDTIGWPTYHDEPITPVHNYSEEQLLDNLFSPNVTDPNSLQNFPLVLRAKPVASMDEIPEDARTEAYYGLNPELSRAYVVMPDLMKALQTIYSSFPLTTDGTQAAVEFLSRPENRYIVRATNIAYRVMGRLLCPSDRGQPVVDAHTALTR